jgi:4-diphosphocytidyl-2-C-methyl-D-erythritol kinase
MAITALAPAKLNLALAVGPPDGRGMHPICSWMVTISLCDHLEISRLPEDRLSRYAISWHADAPRPREIDWPTTSDLAVRAHLAIQEHVQRSLPVQLKLEKRIPVGGGLGGGSSDAAATLRVVNELFELGLADDTLRPIAAGLGSDVPFFVSGGSAIVGGFGERIDPLDETRPLHAVVVFPDAACPTGEVYSVFDRLADGPSLRADEVHALATRPIRPDGVFNDLAAAAVEVVPALAEPLRKLAELAERPAHVAGSGSSLFVLCDDQQHAERLATLVRDRLELPAAAVRGPQTLSLTRS